MSLGERIKEARLALGLTQESLAERVGVVPQTISKWERNESQPDVPLLSSLADVLELSLDRLFGRRSARWADAETALTAWLLPKGEKEKMEGVQELMGFCFNLLMGRYNEEGVLVKDPYGDGDPRYPEEWDYTLLGDEGLGIWRRNEVLPLGLFIGEGKGWLPLFEDPDQLAPLWEALADPDARRTILRSLSQRNLPFDRAEAAEILETGEPERLITLLTRLNLLYVVKAKIDGEEIETLHLVRSEKLLALLLLARALFGPVTARASIGAVGEHRFGTPPLRRKDPIADGQ